MSGKKTLWTERVALNLLRIVSGFLFWQHGVQKLFGILGRDAPVDFFTLLGLAGILEIIKSWDGSPTAGKTTASATPCE